MMNRSTKVRIAILAVIMLATMAIEAQGDLLTLTFDATIHGRPCRIIISQSTSTEINPDADAPTYTTIWLCEVKELDDAPVTPVPTTIPTVSPTVSPTVTPGPTTTPLPGGYVALETSAKFHLPDCYHVRGKEVIHFATCELAYASGRTPCGSCDPCQ